MAPFLEDPHTGPTATFCAATAARLRCYVAAGYAERLAPSELERGADADGTTVDLVGANSALVYAPNGAREAAYRKTHLFSVDRAWAKPARGPLRGARARVLVLLNAWIDSGVEEQRAEDWATLNAWATRLWPLWHRKKRTGGGGLGGGERADGEGEDEDEDTLVLVCNRTGVEDGITFAGSSALFRLRPSARKPYLLENMGRREEGVCIWEV
ncbi:hypothetical protein BC834DRAFT_864504 [Gloeopeniophorella convolvens]|nr:hypothetical protein BC834DRAFT_864504 [Gloeopeniophorella convolvens]